VNRSGNRSLLLPILLFVAGILLILGLSTPGFAPDNPITIVLAPLQQVLRAAGTAIAGLFQGTSDTQVLRARNTELEVRLRDLEIENLQLREFKATASQYRSLLSFAVENPSFGIVGADVIGLGIKACADEQAANPGAPSVGICANVIGTEVSPYSRYVVVNAGRIHGIREGMAVVGGSFGLAGRVALVNETTSQVLLLIDPASSVNVVLVGSRATGTVVGQSDGSLRISNVLQSDEITPDDVVVTSGLGGLLPRLLPVGRVDRITSTDAQLFKEAVIRPAVDFNRLESVLIISATVAAK
jgi:rod shape-determining protein MreC